MTLDPQALAEAVGQALFSRDPVAKSLGIRLLEISPGRARMEMRVRPDMVNGHGTCHGGMIFTLADACFAYACHSRNRNAVAQRADISFIATAPVDALLTAIAEERATTGRSGVYDISVTDEQGRTIGLFRGHSRQISGDVVPA